MVVCKLFLCCRSSTRECTEAEDSAACSLQGRPRRENVVPTGITRKGVRSNFDMSETILERFERLIDWFGYQRRAEIFIHADSSITKGSRCLCRSQVKTFALQLALLALLLAFLLQFLDVAVVVVDVLLVGCNVALA